MGKDQLYHITTLAIPKLDRDNAGDFKALRNPQLTRDNAAGDTANSNGKHDDEASCGDGIHGFFESEAEGKRY